MGDGGEEVGLGWVGFGLGLGRGAVAHGWVGGWVGRTGSSVLRL